MRTLLTWVLLIVGLATLILVGGLIAYHQPDRTVAELAPKWAKKPSQFIHVNGMQMHLRDQGPRNDPHPIILIHGTSASLHTWEGWTQALISSRRVVRFDLPGFGLTGPNPANDYRIETYAETVVSVLNRLGIERGIIVGNSLGGYIAWATAVLHPNRVEKLVLINASGYVFKSRSSPIGFKIASHPVLSKMMGNMLPRSIIETSLKNVYSDKTKVTPALIDQYYDMVTRAGNRAALPQRFTQTIAGELVKRIGSISQSTLIIWGEDDNLIPLDLAHRFAQDISESTLVIMPDVGHVPQEEAPAKSVAIFLSFLEQAMQSDE